MCSGSDCLIYYFFIILIFFSVLIYFLLKYRNSLQKENLDIAAGQVWNSIARPIGNFDLSKSNLLFGVWQDASATVICLLIKDSKNQLVGQVLKPLGRRQQTIKINDQDFLIEFPLTWKRTAILHAPNGAGIIARYIKTGWFRHEFDLPGYGVLISSWPGLNFKAIFNYKLKEKLIGTSQNISSSREKGRLLILPSEIPLEIRIFILAV